MTGNLIMASAESFFIPRGHTGCLLIHGFTGTPKEMRMLGDSLAEADYTVLAPRLFGHATSPEDLMRSRYTDWIGTVEDGLNLLKGCTEQQVVMGLSMGGVLALIAAARYNFAAAVAFSTPTSLPQDPRSAFLPLIAGLNLRIEKGTPDWRNPDAAKDHQDYPYYPSRSILELSKLIALMHDELDKISTPVLLVQSKADTFIPTESLDTIYREIQSAKKEKFWVQDSGHVIIREPERELIFTQVKTFLTRHLTNK